MSKSIFDGDLPKPVSFDTISKINIKPPVEDISFEPVNDDDDKPKPGQPSGPADTGDGLDEIERMLGGKIEEAINAETGESVAGEAPELDENGEPLGEQGFDDADFDGPSIADMFEAGMVVDIIEEFRTSGYMKAYEYRAGVKNIRAYYRYLSGKNGRTETEQKAWEMLDKMLEKFGHSYDELRDKIQWTEKHKQWLKQYIDREMAKLGDKRVPIWLYLIFVEGVAITRVLSKDTHRSDIPFEIPDDVPDMKV